LVLKKKFYKILKNKMTKKNIKSSNKSFGILFFVIFTLIAIWPTFNSGEIRTWSLLIGIFFLILGLINSRFLSPLNFAWVKFGEVLGRIVAPVVMAIIYFFVITPIGLFMRLIGKDLLSVKFLKKNSYWIKREKDVGSMRKQF
tara:strand:- start:2157 stop:2585 length:429 start_codon:yes stop_codon:yes gene_type:complete